MNYTDEMILSELAENPEMVLGKGASASTLHFCSPAHGGWGVIRTALLVPEAYLLFVCPPACGRHGAIAAIEQGQRDRIAYLCLEDREIILGSYQDEIEKGIRQIMERVRPRPKALMIFTSCIDDLLGTDHDPLIEGLESDYGIPIRHARMNPISLDGPLPPPLGIQKTMYELLLPRPPKAAGSGRGTEAGKAFRSPEKDGRVLLLGCFKSPAADSELARFLAFCGAGPIAHPDFCGTFESFRSLAQCGAALIIRPEGKAAAGDLGSSLGIPVLPAFVGFDRAAVLERYRNMAVFFKSGKEGELERYFEGAMAEREEREGELRSVLGDARIALDGTATCAPFSLALALVQAGLKVCRIYANQLPDFEKNAFGKLRGLKGDIVVANPNHAKKYGKRPSAPLADISIGFEAAYATSSPITVPLAFDEYRYGFEGYSTVLKETLKSLAGERYTLRDQVKAYGLVV
ncbi:MAG: hypothetical protein LBT87_04465 [Treponema sp.]|jgi:hypothetical protein|nr:hypothetical protein [Treponema sp.]